VPAILFETVSEKINNNQYLMEKTQMKKLIMMLIVLGLVNIATVSEAAMLDVRVDFQNGGAVPAGNWNAIEWSGYSTMTSGLKDYNTGLATTVATIGASWGAFDWGEAWPTAVDWVENAAAIDGFAGAGTSTQTFSGLSSLKNYKVEVVSAESGLGICTLTINGLYANTNYDNNMTGNVSQNWDMKAARINEDWMIWSSIAPDTNGNLVISLTTGGGWGVLNAVRISEVPEPATIAILGLGGLSLLRRKRSKA
jgi:hypothetical protein